MAVMKIDVTKGKAQLEIDTDSLPEIVYKEALAQGLKVLLNRSMTKITKEAYPNPNELKAAAMAKAAETLEAMKAGKIRIMGAKADKVSGKVMTEARRIAKNMVKEEMKAQKIKISYVDAKDITAAANALIAANPDIVEEAKKNIEAQEAKTKGALEKINLASLVPINEKKKGKIEAEKAQAKAQLSKTQAGKTAVRAKPVTA